MEHENQTEYKYERKEFLVTIGNACTIHCDKQSHILRHFSHWFLGELSRR